VTVSDSNRNDPPDPPRTLSYATPEKQSLPIGVQAFLGTVSTLGTMVLLVIVFGFLSMAFQDKRSAVTFLIMMAILPAVLCITFASRMKRNPRHRGWVIGIYVGLGLSGLLWGYCGYFLHGFH
jgi:hypothetical protein